MTGTSAYTFTVPDGETLAFDLRNHVFAQAHVIRIPDGVTATRKLSAAKLPGNKFVSPETDASKTASGATESINAMELTPFAWLSVAASGGDCFVDITAYSAENIDVHNSATDTPTNQSVPSVSVAVGESVTVPVAEFFIYDKGSIDVNAVSSGTGNVTVSTDPNTGDVTFTGVAASAGTNVTVTGTTPTEETTSITVPVVITA